METSIKTSSLLRGVQLKELEPLLHCLVSSRKSYQKGEFLVRAGQEVVNIGLVVKGSVVVQYTDAWGNTALLDKRNAGEAFCVTYACMSDQVCMVDVVAESDCEIMFFAINKVSRTCEKNCAYHAQMLENVLHLLAHESFELSMRSMHCSPKSIRDRVMSYLSYQSRLQGANSFEISLNRQQLASYLNVDRSALSAELSRMKNEGIIQVERNHFVLL